MGLWAGGREGGSRHLLSWPSFALEDEISIPQQYGLQATLFVGSIKGYGTERTWGTHFGATNDPASMSRTPVCASLRMSSILVFSGIDVFSFCSPSRGPTSTIRTSSARDRGVVERHRADRQPLALESRRIRFVEVFSLCDIDSRLFEFQFLE